MTAEGRNILRPAPVSVKSEKGGQVEEAASKNSIRTKDSVRASVDACISDAEVNIINRPVAIRVIQRCAREVACVFTMINVAKFDIGPVCACGTEVQREARHFCAGKRSQQGMS